MKKISLLFLFGMLFILPSHAVLKEKDLDNTLSVLRVELKDYHDELERQSGYMKIQKYEKKNVSSNKQGKC